MQQRAANYESLAARGLPVEPFFTSDIQSPASSGSQQRHERRESSARIDSVHEGILRGAVTEALEPAVGRVPSADDAATGYPIECGVSCPCRQSNVFQRASRQPTKRNLYAAAILMANEWLCHYLVFKFVKSTQDKFPDPAAYVGLMYIIPVGISAVIRGWMN